jgi:pteridine reductase
MTHKNNMKDNEKVALITGAAKRIGAATTRMLHDAGYRVIIHYRSSDEAAEELATELNMKRDGSTRTIQADFEDEQCYQSVADRAVDCWGRLDVLVNNASSFFPTPVGSITFEDWDHLVNSNMKAPLFLSQALAPALTETKGCIVNMLDVHAQRPMREHTVYCAAKAGLHMITLSLAKELGPDIRVNGVAPGAILWPENDMNDDTKKLILDRTALKRAGEPNDIARTILFLVQDAGYITGQLIAVDGGRSINI